MKNLKNKPPKGIQRFLRLPAEHINKKETARGAQHGVFLGAEVDGDKGV